MSVSKKIIPRMCSQCPLEAHDEGDGYYCSESGTPTIRGKRLPNCPYNAQNDFDCKECAEVLDLIKKFGDIGGNHHKQWLLDQILRVILQKDYKDEIDCNFPDWDCGIAP